MLSQEEYMDVLALKRQGLTVAEIAVATGYHPATISKWLKEGGPPPTRAVAASERAVDEAWAGRIAELLQPAPRLLATSVYEIIAAEGFAGSYSSVVRHLRGLRGPRFRAAPGPSVPIETAPGEECQFDWTDCSEWAPRLGLEALFCFGAILCWSRARLWWFTTSVDREHTFEGLVRFFEAMGACRAGPAPIGWGLWARARAGAFASMPRPSTSPAPTASTSSCARAATPSARARWSAPSEI
jgi:transposase